MRSVNVNRLIRLPNLPRCFFWQLFVLASLVSCSTTKTSIADRKYPRKHLQEDYRIFRGALEEGHPSLYWFTPKDSVDKRFSDGYSAIKDSMTERQFKTLLNWVVTAFRCGHTSVAYSKQYSRYLDTAAVKMFPLAFKVWPDTLVVIGNLNKKDSLLTRGTVVTEINGKPARELIHTFLDHTTGDGYSVSGRYQSLSSYGAFGVLYKNVYGLTDTFNVTYIDEFGFESRTKVPVFVPESRSAKKTDSLKPEKYTQKERRTLETFATRHVQVDTSLKSAYMMLNSFSNGNKLRRFFRSSFRSMKKLNIQHLVIDVRSNGGGEAGNSTLLTRYLSDHKFKVAHSLYTNKRSSSYRDYIPFQPVFGLISSIITHRKEDGKFHFGFFERHRFKVHRKYHFNKNIYILTGGNSFSATTLFAQELKGQKNVKIIGEETGGGAYGNTAWIIPQLKLPYTKIRVGIPKFRFIMRPELVEEGRGVMPDYHVAPNADDIRRGVDVKLQAVKRMIIEANSQ